MLDGIDALAALQQWGTMGAAAARLRLSQSAVSKRLAMLERQVGFRLHEPDGRRVKLTARAGELLAEARPLVAELRALLRPAPPGGPARLTLALADSIASSWGPAALRAALAAIPGLTVELHAHRSVLVIENLRLGRYQLGLCTEAAGARDLVQDTVAREAMVLLHAGLAARPARALPLITIEPTSATFRAIEPDLRAHHPDLLAAPLFVESFGAAVQMVRAGFGNGLVPLGLPRELGLPRRAYRSLPGIARRIALVTRKSLHGQPAVTALRARLADAIAAHLAVR